MFGCIFLFGEDINVQIQYKIIPISIFKILKYVEYNNGTEVQGSRSYIQDKTEKVNRTILLLFMKEYETPIKSLFFGLGTGVSFSINPTSVSWDTPIFPNDYSGSIIAPVYLEKEPNYVTLRSQVKKKLKEKTNIFAIPVVLQSVYKIPLSDKIKIHYKLNGGMYIIHSNMESINESIYVNNTGLTGINIGDKEINEYSNTNIKLTSNIGTEIDLEYILSEKFSLLCDININYLNRVRFIEERTYTYQADEPYGKDGVEIGGFGYGAGISLRTKF